MMALIVIVVVIFIIIMFGVASEGSSEDVLNKMKTRNGLLPTDNPESIGKFVGGHPKINKGIEYCTWFKRGNELYFCESQYKFERVGKPQMTISIDKINDIVLEDATTMDRRVTLGRVLLVGIFALAWRKNKKNEMAFVVIEWNDGKFKHSTTFAYEGKDAMIKANGDRNKLIEAVTS